MRKRGLFLIIDRVAIVLFNILLIAMVLWATIIPIAKSRSFYFRQYDKFNTYEASGYSEEELALITDTIIAYLFDETDDMQVEISGEIVFSNQALIHMSDVKDLFIGGQKLAWLLLCIWVLVIVYLYLRFAMIKQYLFKVSLITIAVVVGVVVVVGIWAIFDFNHVFELFHHIIFPDEIKFRDAFFSDESYYDELPGVNNRMLIIILSTGLFMNIGIIIGIAIVVVLLVWLTALGFLRKKWKEGYV